MQSVKRNGNGSHIFGGPGQLFSTQLILIEGEDRTKLLPGTIFVDITCGNPKTVVYQSDNVLDLGFREIGSILYFKISTSRFGTKFLTLTVAPAENRGDKKSRNYVGLKSCKSTPVINTTLCPELADDGPSKPRILTKLIINKGSAISQIITVL